MHAYFRAALVVLWLPGLNSPMAAGLFDDSTPLDVKLTGPLAEVIETKDERMEHPFTLLVAGVEHDVAVRVRGKSRLRVCRFPPLRLNFGEQVVDGSPFSGQDKLKLVTPCRDGDRAQTDTFEEYVAYRIFNALTETGFQARLLRITYSDTAAGSAEETTRFGFVIERIDRLAQRLDAEVAKPEGVRLSALNARQAATMYVFQYLIGNTDWSLVMADGDDACCHNVDIIEKDGELFPIPYDFDQAGLVNTRYARPDPSIGISRVTQRRYRGYCMDAADLDSAVASIVEARQQVMAVPTEIPHMTDRATRQGARYLERFFDEAEDRSRLVRSFEKRCL